MSIVNYQRITCDRCKASLDVPEPADMDRLRQTVLWVIVNVSNVTGSGLTGGDLHQLNVLCAECRRSLAKWMVAGPSGDPSGDPAPASDAKS